MWENERQVSRTAALSSSAPQRHKSTLSDWELSKLTNRYPTKLVGRQEILVAWRRLNEIRYQATDFPQLWLVGGLAPPHLDRRSSAEWHAARRALFAGQQPTASRSLSATKGVIVRRSVQLKGDEKATCLGGLCPVKLNLSAILLSAELTKPYDLERGNWWRQITQ